MLRDIGWGLALVLILSSGALLAERAVPSRTSLLPVLRAGQEHARQVERLGATAFPVNADEERRLGDKLCRALPDGPSRGEVERIGRRLERTGLLRRYAGRTRYVTVPGHGNAHAAPGGTVIVGERLIERMEGDSSRLAFIIGHELAHGELGHTADQVRYRAWFGGEALQVLRMIPALAYSETQELEADALSLKLMALADFRLTAAGEALERLSSEGPERDGVQRVIVEALSDYPRTHPGKRERINKLGTPPIFTDIR